VQHLGSNGKLVKGPAEWIGLWFKNVDKKVLEELETRGLLFAAKAHAHSYPFCYRCETPLFYNAVNSWFVDIQKIKPKLLEQNENINWHPEYLKEGGFKHILETAPDWSLSRNRFWATSIPVWKCGKCNKIEVLGSVAELREKAIEKLPQEVDLHKHVVDLVHLKCACGGEMKRIPEVLDCWFESASMPYAAKHYPFENKEWFATGYPADFVSEYLPQVRAWFYYMHVLGVLVFGKPPFRNVVVTGTLRASDGLKMSKSKGNFVDPNIIFEKYGADAVRFYLVSATLMRAQDTNFNEEDVKEVFRSLTMLENVKSFYSLFGNGNDSLVPGRKNVLDRWIVSKLNLLVKNCTAYLDDYNTVTYCAEILKFIDEFSTWYVRRSRGRFKGTDVEDRKDAAQTLAFSLDVVAKVIAPVAPFIAEEIYLSLKPIEKLESVHLESWPIADESLIDSALMEKMSKVREVVSSALEKREKAGVAIRQAIPSMKLGGVSLEPELLELIKDEVNVKKIDLAASDSLLIELDVSLTPELIREGIARDLIRKVNGYRKEMKLTIQDRVVLFVESADAELNLSVDAFSDEIKSAVQADRIETKVPADAAAKEIQLGKATAKIGIKTI